MTLRQLERKSVCLLIPRLPVLLRAVFGSAKATCLVLGLLFVAPEHLRAEDLFDQSKSAARAWQLSQKLGPFLFDRDVVVPVDIPSGCVTHQAAIVRDSLGSFKLDSAPGNHVHILDDGRYILYGDLFHTGDVYVLVQLPVVLESDPYWNGARLALAEPIDGKWQLRGLWNINSEWQSKGGAKANDTHFPVTPAEAPFELVDFTGGGAPEVIMAGEIGRYYQMFYLLRFDAKSHGLTMLAEAAGKPVLSHGYIRLYYNSGHRAIFQEWDFAKLVNGELREVASWHDGTPYNPGDDEGLRAKALDVRGELKEYEIDNDDADNGVIDPAQSTYKISDRGTHKEVAAVVFLKINSKNANSDFDYEDIEKAWLFHHITGLPQDSLPIGGYSSEGEGKKLPPLTEFETVKISGNPDFVRRLKRVDLAVR